MRGIVAGAAGAVLVGLAPRAVAQDAEKGLDSAEVIAKVSPSVVIVEHTYRYDNGEAPAMEIAGMAYRQADQDEDWASLITQERPGERLGFVIAPDLVLTVDPLVHGRFVEKVEVRDGDRRIGATAEAFAVAQNAVLLRLDEALTHAEPVAFDAGAEGPYRAVSSMEGNGRWWLSVDPVGGQSYTALDGPAWDVVGWPSLIVSEDGTGVTASFNGGLETDGSWKVAPVDWDWRTAGEFGETVERVGAIADASLPRVELRFRSPSGDADGAYAYGYGDYSEDVTEWNGTGVLLDEHRVLVLAKLEPKVTARLESARVHLADGRTVGAEFVGSLREYAGLVVELGESAGGAATLSARTLHDVEDELLVRSQVRVLGESRTSYTWRARLPRMSRGFQGRLLGYFGEVSTRQMDTQDGSEGPVSFLFTLDGELVALPLMVRGKVVSQNDWEGWSRSDYEATVLGASDVAGILAGGDVFDPDNRPLSEEEENRLAWLGVELQAMDPDLARFNGVVDVTNGGMTGGIVTYVYEGSPAARAGLEVGDILLRLHIEGQPRPLEVEVSMYDMGWGAQFLEVLDQIDPSYFDQVPPPWGSAETALTRALTDVGFRTPFVAEVFRDGEILRPEFVVEEGPAHFGAAAKFKSEAAGLTVKDLTYEARRFLQLSPDDAGVIVSKVEQGERAAVAGVKPFELIVAVNDEPVHSVGEFEAAVSGGGELRLSVMRMHMGRLVKIRVPEQ